MTTVVVVVIIVCKFLGGSLSKKHYNILIWKLVKKEYW